MQACQNENGKNKDEAATTVTDSAAKTQANATTINLSSEEKSFVSAAAAGGMMEVEAGKLVSLQSQNTAVKAFALQMVKDHTKANEELTAIATRKGMALPATLPAEQLKHLKQLQTLTGKELDKHYITMMIDDHMKTVDLFGRNSKFNDTELKTFALNTLPIIQMHYKKAVELGKKLNISNMNNGDNLSNVSPDSASLKH